MNIRFKARVERLRSSLFFVPMVFVLAGVLLAETGVRVDRLLEGSTNQLPEGLRSTVGSAREVLTVVAAATIGFAGIAFSVSLLIIQLASSQYSPRIVQGIFRDPFNRRVMGIVLGTFTYCLVLLRSVRSPLEDGGNAEVPHLSILLAVFLGVTAILAIVAFIDHSAHSMDLSKLLQSVTDDALATVEHTWSVDERQLVDDTDSFGNGDAGHEREGPGHQGDEPGPEGDDPGHTITFDGSGWVQQLDRRALVCVAAPGGTVRFETSVGRYAIAGTPLCTVWPAPGDHDVATARARNAVHLGPSRTAGQDSAYGIRQLVDVGVKALSTGVNDPTTAQDAIFHLGVVVRAMLVNDPPPLVMPGPDDRRLILSEAPTHADMIELAFAELRQSAANAPTVCVYLLEVLHLLCQAFEAESFDERIRALVHQADLVMAGCEHAGVLPADLATVRAAYRSRFGDDSGRAGAP